MEIREDWIKYPAEFDRSSLTTMIKRCELELNSIRLWIEHEYSTFRPTDGAVDRRSLELSQRLEKYVYIRNEHSKFVNALLAL